MSESVSPTIDNLKPGDVIEFDDITELASFEDLVATHIDQRVPELIPGMSTRLNMSRWAGRQALSELIRPQKPRFNGTIADIQLEVMADPYEQLQTARERGWNIGMGFRTLSSSEKLIPAYHGFTFLANAKSSGRGTVGQIQSELWYCPTPLQVGTRSTQTTSMHGGSSVYRTVAKPKLELEKYMRIHEESRKIGFQVLRQNMLKPMRG